MTPTGIKTLSDISPDFGRKRPPIGNEPCSIGINTRFTEKTARLIVEIAEKKNCSASSVIRRLVEKALEAGITV